jgi:hypothetical protein
MKTIKIRPSKRFAGWTAFKAPGVAPTFPGPNGKHNAIDYARGRFGGSSGEIGIYDDAGETVIETIKVDGGPGYGQPTRYSDCDRHHANVESISRVHVEGITSERDQRGKEKCAKTTS